MKIHLYKFNKVTGYWVIEREVSEDTAEQWQRIFQADNPSEYFYTSRRVPSFDPVARDRTKGA